MTPRRLPGSFDPVTNGHLDIVARAAGLFDEVVVAIGVNVSKNRLFDARGAPGDAARGVCADLANVRVEGFSGLLIDFCREIDVRAIVKGLRGGQRLRLRAADGPDERQPGTGRRDRLRARPPRSTRSWRPRLVKEVAAFGGDVSGLVPEFVHDRLVERLARLRADERAVHGARAFCRAPPSRPATIPDDLLCPAHWK